GHNHLAELDSAVRCYERAAELFKASGKFLEAARTNVGHMSALNKIGQFDRVQALAEAARLVFVEQNDLHYQAVVNMNLGVLHEKQGQYTQALEYYRQAADAFQSLGEVLYFAMNQVNQANMLMFLDVFLMAEQLHEQARSIFETAGLRSLVA